MRQNASTREELYAICSDLGDDEIRVMLFVAQRLAMGQAHYGKLDLRRDQRDFVREAAEEGADLMVYAACEALRRAVR